MKVSLQGAAKVLFGVWVILLLPWLMMVPLTVMAFDGGPTVLVYTFLFCFWTYPFAVVIVAIFRKKFPLIALLPCLHIALFVYFD